jgi:polar amino acid transport system ATP-binding protein
VIFMDNGNIIEEGPPNQVFSKPRSPRTRQFLQSVLNRNGGSEQQLSEEQEATQ